MRHLGTGAKGGDCNLKSSWCSGVTAWAGGVRGWTKPLGQHHPLHTHTAAQHLGFLLTGRGSRAEMTSEMCCSERGEGGGGGGRERKDAFPKQLSQNHRVHELFPPAGIGGGVGLGDQWAPVQTQLRRALLHHFGQVHYRLSALCFSHL